MTRWRSRSRCLLAALLAALLLPFGCSPYRAAGKYYHCRPAGLTVQLPDQWKVFTPARKCLTLTKDGLRLEQITITLLKYGTKLPNTERRYQADMLPHDLAALSLGLLEAQDRVKNLKVERVELIRLAGRDGYRTTAVFTDPEGLKKKLVLVGLPLSSSLCEFTFEAETTVYFPRYVPDFKRMIASVELK